MNTAYPVPQHGLNQPQALYLPHLTVVGIA